MAARRLFAMIALTTVGLAQLFATAFVGAPATRAATIPLSATQTSAPVTVTLNSMSPRSPDANNLTQPVRFTATISNNSDVNYTDFAVGLERGAAITRQSLLDTAILVPPATDQLLSSNDQDERRSLPAHSSVKVTYVSDPSSQKMCLCVTAVYPYALVVRAETVSSGGFAEVGRTQVLVPSFLQAPKPVTVSWIWPLIDRPHRSTSDTVFNDDLLATSVALGGRLYRALEVAEKVAAAKVRMTLVVDPDLLDSLAVMAGTDGYEYRESNRTVVGQGGPAARAWLDRLAALGPAADIVLTGYADPDVNAATRAGLPYSTALDPQVQARIGSTVAGVGSGLNQLSWPEGEALTSKALDALISAGSSAVLLSDRALSGQNKTDPRPDAVSPLPSASGRALALVTDSAIERTVVQALKLGAIPAQAQQTLLGQLAIRAVASPSVSHYVVLTPDRYVDTDPTAATSTIVATAKNGWSSSMSVPRALTTVTPVNRGPLQTAAESATGEVSRSQLNQVVDIEHKVASLREALNSDAAATLLAGFNTGLQRAQSSAWRTDRAAGAAVVAELSNAIDSKLNAVSLVKPADGTYSLSSANSPLLVTVRNGLSRAVTVRVSVAAGGGIIGFRSPSVTTSIPALEKKTITIPTHVDRLGQFMVTASLSTPDGQQLGDSIQLSLRSTALGSITKTITIVAAAVLVLALIRRFSIRIRNARAGRSPGVHQ
jgi:hypothetical protein